jgi:hypothetical protein
MSLFPDITPLTNEIKVFNSQLTELKANSLQTNQLLTQQNQLLTEIKELLIKK